MNESARLAQPPVLLLDPDYYGTLAAVRCLGRRGIDVTVAGPDRSAVSFWSRFTRRRLAAPSKDDPDALLDWLRTFGAREPGHVLYATSDDVAWVLAQHREELASHFVLCQPDAEVLRLLLDKCELHRLCAHVGLATPHTDFPESDGELESAASSARFPLLIKPRSQVFLRTRLKGMVVREAGGLAQSYASFRRDNPSHPRLETLMPGSSWPMLQQVHEEAQTSIYSLAGFIGPEHNIVAVASRKILQRPRKLGVGLCFEEAQVDGALLQRVAALCKAAGYFGVFEVEFIETPRGPLLIDFNPRYYSQMGFEVGRGLPLPFIAYEAALHRNGALRAVAENMAMGKHVYLHRVLFEVIIRGQALTRRLTAEDSARWREWLKSNESHAVDAVADQDDRIPGLLDVYGILRQLVRHPRSFIRQFWLDQ